MSHLHAAEWIELQLSNNARAFLRKGTKPKLQRIEYYCSIHNKCQRAETKLYSAIYEVIMRCLSLVPTSRYRWECQVSFPDRAIHDTATLVTKTCALRNYECKSFPSTNATVDWKVFIYLFFFFTAARLNMSRVVSSRTAARQNVAMSRRGSSSEVFSAILF